MTEVQEIIADGPEDSVTYDQQAVGKGTGPFKNEKFLRKYVSRRLLALDEGEIAALMTAMRQLGVGSQVVPKWVAGSLNAPLARNKIDERSLFGTIEWNAARGSPHFLSKHAAYSWKNLVEVWGEQLDES